MAGNYRKPKDSDDRIIPFKIVVEGKEYSDSFTEARESLAFGIPSAFYVNIPGEPRTLLSIIRGEWVMNATESFVKALSEGLEPYYE